MNFFQFKDKTVINLDAFVVAYVTTDTSPFIIKAIYNNGGSSSTTLTHQYDTKDERDEDLNRLYREAKSCASQNIEAKNRFNQIQ